MGSFVLHGNIIDSESPERLRVAADSYLVCEEGRCTGVFSALPERFSGLPLTDFGDRLILPGMTDLHLHAPQFAFRGLGMDLELLDWLNAHTFPEEAKYADLSYVYNNLSFTGHIFKHALDYFLCILICIIKETIFIGFGLFLCLFFR